MTKRAVRSKHRRRETAQEVSAVPPARAAGPRAQLVICLLLTLVTAFIYQQTLHHDFINLDDNDYAFENKYVQVGLTARGFRHAFSTYDASNWHPLTWLSLMLDGSIARATGGKLVVVCHFTNIVLHIACVLLLFAVLARMTGSVWKSAFVAALFAVHPLHVQSVAWVAERKDVLSTLFWLLTMVAYVWYAAQPRLGRYMLVFVLLALGLMAKPMLVSLPFVLLLLDYWPLGRLQVKGYRLQGNSDEYSVCSLGLAILEKVPLIALSVASSVMTCRAQATTAMQSLDIFPLGVRIANAVYSAGAYLWKMVWPQKLSVFYPHLGRHIPPEQVAGAVLLLVCITALVIMAARRRPYLAVGWLWYLVTLVPVIGLVQVGVQGMADRYTYVPLIGVFIMIAWGVPDLLSSRPAQPKTKARQESRNYVLPVLAIAMILALIPVAYRQVSCWRDTTRLFTHAVTIFPKYAEGHMVIGQDAELKGLTDKAIARYTLALELNPGLAEARMNLGKLTAERKEWDAAAEHYSAYLGMRPDNVAARCSLGDVLLQQGDYEAALREFKRAAHSAPDFAKAHYGQGAALMSLQREEEAEPCFSRAVELKPDYGDAHAALAFVLCLKGDYPGAWREVRLSRRYGVEPNPDVLTVLSQRMPKPRE